MNPPLPEWLYQGVPLWAFLLALLTHPAKWSGWLIGLAEKRLRLEGSGSSRSPSRSQSPGPGEQS